MPTYEFNLIDRPWLWGVWAADGHRELISLRAALSRAGALRELHGDTPPETAALHRLLLTLLYQVFDPNQDWETLWQAQELDGARLAAYLDRPDIYPRFDLFHPVTPFFQTTTGWTENSKWQTVSDLNPHFASGNDAALFDHRQTHSSHHAQDECGTTLSAAAAARALVTQQAFGFGGTKGRGASFSNAPCARSVVLLLEGVSLRETLLLNFFPLDLSNHFLASQPEDQPAWEMADPFHADPRRPYGYRDYSTWLTRRVLLRPEGDPADPQVCQMRYHVGLGRMAGNPLNPLLAYFPNPKPGSEGQSSFLPLTFRPKKALWRDSSPLFTWRHDPDKHYLPPRAFHWVYSEVPDTFGPLLGTRRLFVGAYGICSNPGKDKFYFYRAERFPLPAVYLAEVGLQAAKALKLALERAEAVGRILSPAGALGAFAKIALNSGDPTQVRNLVEATGAERRYWARLEAPFYHLIEDLPTDIEAAVAVWDDTLRHLAQDSFEAAVRTVAPTRGLPAYGQTIGRFNEQIKQVFNPTPKEERRKDAQRAV